MAGAAPEGDASIAVYAADSLNRILVKCGLAESGSEATRKIKQGGVQDRRRATSPTSAGRFPGQANTSSRWAPDSSSKLVLR